MNRKTTIFNDLYKNRILYYVSNKISELLDEPIITYHKTTNIDHMFQTKNYRGTFYHGKYHGKWTIHIKVFPRMYVHGCGIQFSSNLWSHWDDKIRPSSVFKTAMNRYIKYVKSNFNIKQPTKVHSVDVYLANGNPVCATKIHSKVLPKVIINESI